MLPVNLKSELLWLLFIVYKGEGTDIWVFIFMPCPAPHTLPILESWYPLPLLTGKRNIHLKELTYWRLQSLLLLFMGAAVRIWTNSLVFIAHDYSGHLKRRWDVLYLDSSECWWRRVETHIAFKSWKASWRSRDIHLFFSTFPWVHTLCQVPCQGLRTQNWRGQRPSAVRGWWAFPGGQSHGRGELGNGSWRWV